MATTMSVMLYQANRGGAQYGVDKVYAPTCTYGFFYAERSPGVVYQ